ncbi:MAG: HU family DNA-binding protein [Deferribacteraceae bacterium]|jgi:nucleoid DNA-binding protein|nr:HU family DNA-binding protein [Deferribacteraceae bacterium]
MNKQGLVDAVASKTGLTKKESQAAVSAVVNSITRTVQKGEDVVLIGFGSFKQTSRKAREGRNPQTGDKINIPAKKAPKFVAGKAFKDALK